MDWPKLVPPAVCTTPIDILVQSGYNPDGSPRHVMVYRGICNYSEKSKWVTDGKGGWVQLQAAALFDGDILPGKDIAGIAIINGGQVTRRIHAAARGRNLDGTVNYTQLELI